VAEWCSTLSTPVQTDLLDVSAPLEEGLDYFFGSIMWQASNPNSPAILRLVAVYDHSLLTDSVSCHRLVLCVVQSNRNSLDQSACFFNCLINCISFKELHMTELAILELVHLQADHLNLATYLKDIDEVLLLCFYRYISTPQGMPTSRFHTPRLVPTAIHMSLIICFPLFDCFVHVSIVERHFLPFELLT